MSKVTGISLGRTEVRVVELDGSARRFRVTQAFVAPLDRGALVDVKHEEIGDVSEEKGRVRALATILRERKVSRDHVALILPGQDCLVRNANLAIKGEDQLRKVIKFEAEGWFHSVDIDDVVVDFLTTRETEEGTEFLVAAAQKGPLKHLLDRAQSAGADPELVELDGVAIFKAVSTLGCLNEEACQVVLDLGNASSRILVTRAGQLIGLRTLRFGLENYFAPVGPPPVEEEAESEAEGETDAEAPVQPEPRPQLSLVDLDEGKLDQFVSRLGREVGRFLTSFGSAARPTSGLLTGHGGESPVLRESLEKSLGLGLQTIDPLENLEHSLGDDGQLDSSILPALGAAMELIGAAEPGMSFRQEELQFARKFERIKFPLVVGLMLLAFLLVLKFSYLTREKKAYMDYYSTMSMVSKKKGGGLVGFIWKNWVEPNVTSELELRKIDKLARNAKDPMDVIPILKAQLARYKKNEERRLGYYPDLPPLESGLHPLRVFAWHMENIRKAVSGKVLVTNISMRMEGKKNRQLTFDILLWGESARQDVGVIETMLKDSCTYQHSPFKTFERARNEEHTKPVGGIWYKGNKLTIIDRLEATSAWPPQK